jgi:hypothetical protein
MSGGPAQSRSTWVQKICVGRLNLRVLLDDVGDQVRGLVDAAEERPLVPALVEDGAHRVLPPLLEGGVDVHAGRQDAARGVADVVVHVLEELIEPVRQEHEAVVVGPVVDVEVVRVVAVAVPVPDDALEGPAAEERGDVEDGLEIGGVGVVRRAPDHVEERLQVGGVTGELAVVLQLGEADRQIRSTGLVEFPGRHKVATVKSPLTASTRR